MHRIFLINELLELIVHQVPDSQQDSVHTWELLSHERHDIESLSLTSRMFRELCLDVLWQTQYSLLPLFRSVGITVVVPNYKPMPVRKYDLTRSLAEADFPTILQYSRRIKSLSLRKRFHKLTTSALLLASESPVSVLFPQLRTLVGHHQLEPLFVLPRTGVALTNLKLPLMRHSPSVKYLGMVAALEARITSLDLSYHSGSQLELQLCDIICSTLAGIEGLRTLCLHLHIDARVWSVLSGLASLTTLSLNRLSGGFDAFPYGHTLIFPSLSNLTIRVASVIEFTLLLKCSNLPSLRSLDLTVLSKASRSDVLSLSNALVSSCNSALFTTLGIISTTNVNVNALGPVEEPSREDTIRSEALRPLLHFRQMRHLEFTTNWWWDLDDVLIHEMANAWPNLWTLRLDPLAGWSRPCRITLLSLLPLAQSCPNLDYFGVVLDSSPLPSCNSSVDCPPHFIRLCFGSSAVESPEEVAAYLARLFPRGVLEVMGNLDRKSAEGWRRVRQLIASLVAEQRSS
ncbi:hypothetical protein BXZ70DRAFT_491755 [Cristinia sonorae]|uniref:F-box domain-containing protein n=1 Tax=Cristinia sonorae TaxID=1940300 RepID=A0A8K0UJ48_9AGAR|nr:hypothetical protein BXZ70DRAFT_491755 [Cristinia sonorae]